MCMWRSAVNFQEPVLCCHHMGLRVEFGWNYFPVESDSLSYTMLHWGDLLSTVYFPQNKYKFLTNQGNSPNNILPLLKMQAKPTKFYITPALEIDDEWICLHPSERSVDKAWRLWGPFGGGSGSGALSQRDQTYNELAENSERSHFAVPTTNWKGSSYWLKPSMLDMEIFIDELTTSKNSSRLVIMNLFPTLFLSCTFTFRYFHFIIQVIQQRKKNQWRWDTWCLRVIIGRQ